MSLNISTLPENEDSNFLPSSLAHLDLTTHFLSQRRKMGSLPVYSYSTHSTLDRELTRNEFLIQLYDEYKKNCQGILENNQDKIEELWTNWIDITEEKLLKPPPRLVMPWYSTSTETAAFKIICSKYQECSESIASFYAKHNELTKLYLEIQRYMISIEWGRPGGELHCVAELEMFQKEQELVEVLKDMSEVKVLLDYNAAQWLAWVAEREGKAMRNE